MNTSLFYETLGKVSFGIIIAIALLFLISTVLGIILIKKHKIILPKVLLFTNISELVKTEVLLTYSNFAL